MLTIRITKPNGGTRQSRVEDRVTRLQIEAGDRVGVIDDATGRPVNGAVLRKTIAGWRIDGLPDGRSLVLDIRDDGAAPGSTDLVLDGRDRTAPVPTPAPTLASGEPAPLFAQADAVATTTDASAAAASEAGAGTAGTAGSTTAATAGTTGAGAAAFSPMTLALGGAGLVAGAAGGGGGGGSSPAPAAAPGSSAAPAAAPAAEPAPAPAPSPAPTDAWAPTIPVIDAVAGNDRVSGAEKAAGVTVTGTAQAWSSVTVEWGATSLTVTAGATGAWSASFAAGEVPADAATTVSATSRDAAGNLSPTATRPVTVDTATAIPVIAAVSTDDLISAGEKAAGVTVTGSAEANASVEVELGGQTRNVVANGSGAWTAAFAAGELPADGATSVRATATDADGNLSGQASRAVTVDTVVAATAIATVASDDVVNGSEKTAGVVISGTAEAGASVDVSFGGTHKAAVANGSGAWSITFASGEVPADAGSVTITATATDAAGNVGAPVTRTVAIDTSSLQPGIDAVATDNAINAAEKAGGITVTGDAEAGASVDVQFGATHRIVTADGAGHWTAGFVSGEFPADHPATYISAVATDVHGNVSAPNAHLVVLDTAVANPGLLVRDDGSLVVHTEPGALASLDVNLAPIGTAVADGSGIAVFAGPFNAGESLRVTVQDLVGNVSGASTVTGVTVAGTGGADTIVGGGGNEYIAAGAGNDLIVGGVGGHVRNSQFDYWELPSAPPYTGVYTYWDDTVVQFNQDMNGVAGGGLGWSVSAPATEGFTGQALSNSIDGTNVVPGLVPSDFFVQDNANTEGSYVWQTSVDGAHGSGLSQSVLTAPGETYSLRVQAFVNPASNDSSVEIRWDGAVIARYDGVIDQWLSGAGLQTPSTATYDGSKTVWTFGVAATGTSTDLGIEVYGGNASVWFESTVIDRVTLTSSAVEGNNLIVGGAGSDVLMGGAGYDMLIGGTLAASGAAAADGATDVFAFSMLTASGDDRIRGFEVGTDKLALVDLLDTYQGTTFPYDAPGQSWDPVSRPDVSRVPVLSGGAASGRETTSSDNNLSARDLLQADSPNQYVEFTEDGTSAHNVKLVLHGQGGAVLGSVVLEGVQWEATPTANNGRYGSLAELMGDGYMAPDVDAPSYPILETQVLYLTMDGLSRSLTTL